MLSKRVIPSLLIKNGGLVKGKKFANHRYVGDPVNSVKLLNDKEVDELVFLDITATSSRVGPDFELIEDIVSQAFMPIGYGGGISNIEQIERLLKLGVEKIILNSSAVANESLIKSASGIVGSQSVVISIDVKKNIFGKYSVVTQSGQTKTNFDPVEFACHVENCGAGEILLTSIDREGTGAGYDLDLIKSVSNAVEIPVIASGGASKLSDFREATDAGASAVSAGDMFVFHGKLKGVLITYPDYDSLTDLFS